MGITGLIPFLEKASSKKHLKELRGTTVAVDTYCWLHKGVFACAEKLVRGEATDVHIRYCLKYVDLLLSYDIKPILVFDGRHLPAKAQTERRRRETRKEARKRAAELLRLGRIEEARTQMRRSVDVTHDMALCLIRECRQKNVDCIVAPYEADAQMAWLNLVGLAEYVITEDSDLMLFGSKKVIFKLDLTGAGLLVEADKLYLAMGCREEKYTFEKFVRMCILSGCDYLDSLPGIGLSKACKFILMTEETDMRRALKKLPQYLNLKNIVVYDNYIEEFLKAEATFKHMYIFNPLKRKMERLHALNEFHTDEEYCSNAGTPLDNDEVSLQLALGNLNPFSLKQLDNWHPDLDNGTAVSSGNVKRARHKSIWQIEKCNELKVHTTNGDSEKKQVSCAVFFKKVDFITRTIHEDISAEIKKENAKPEETEIFSFYKYNADDRRQSLKRRRTDSNAVDDEVTDNVEPSSPTATRSHYNPFAKICNSAEKQKSPKVCENGSLLKALVPAKQKLEAEEKLNRLSNLRRPIFANMDEPKIKVEVKSRFFAANVEESSKSTLPLPELADEMEIIENRVQENRQNQSQLYHSPSPTKSVTKLIKPMEENTITTDSGVDLLDAVNDNRLENLTETETDAREEECEVNSSKCDDNIVYISDESIDIDQCQAVKQLSLLEFKPAKLTRMGLAKAKTNGSVKKKKSLTRSSSENASQVQTRLSMFGFQKRSTLK